MDRTAETRRQRANEKSDSICSVPRQWRTMRFIFNLTRREIRSSWRRLLFFFLCIALGVGSIVFLRSLIQNLTKVVGNDARALMTADVEVTSTNDFSPVEVAKIEEVVNSYPSLVEARNET